MSRANEVQEFWKEVKKQLVRKHKKSAAQADNAIADYQALLQSKQVVPKRKSLKMPPEIGEVVYNQGEERVATIIAGLIDSRALSIP